MGDSYRDWMKTHSKEGLAKIVTTDKKTIARLDTKRRELGENIKRHQERNTNQLHTIQNLKIEVNGLDSDNQELLKILGHARDERDLWKEKAKKKIPKIKINKLKFPDFMDTYRFALTRL